MASWLRAGLWAARAQLRQATVSAGSFAGVAVAPLSILIIGTFMRPGSPAGGARGVFGSALVGMWSTVFLAASLDISRERTQETLPLIIAAPVPTPVVLIGKILGNALISFTAVAVVFTVAALARLFPLGVNPPLLVSGLVLFAVSSATVGLLVSVAYVVTRAAIGLGNALQMAVWVLCGLLYPVSILPGPVELLARALPMTWSARVVYAAVQGAESSEWVGTLAASSLALAAATTLAAIVLYRAAERRWRAAAEPHD
ncbi:MAG TPA: ABC transporter permease [Actinomycetes bacterium]|jgi:ABC-2 type transport system permease protein|nr:ABC transporter permease [Actinomycetes bacterium]